MYQKTKQKVHILLHPELGESKADKFVNAFIITLIILNVIAVMLETPEAIGRAGEIAAVPGVDMLLIGPADLTAEMGILGDFRHARFREAMAAAAAACRTHGKVLGIAGVSDLELLRDYIAMGLRFINAGNDAGFMVQAGTAQAVKLRGLELPGKN